MASARCAIREGVGHVEGRGDDWSTYLVGKNDIAGLVDSMLAVSCGTVGYAVQEVKERQAKSSLSMSRDMSDSCLMFGSSTSLCTCGEMIKHTV